MGKSVIIIFIAIMTQSCATIFHVGPVTTYQKTKPEKGEPKRKIKKGALLLDILLFYPAVVVDFATGAIYKPEEDAEKIKFEKIKFEKILIKK